MRYTAFEHQGKAWLGIRRDGLVHKLGSEPLESLLARGVDLVAYANQAADAHDALPLDAVRLLAPLRRPPKILCVGLNYRAHVNESRYEVRDDPVFFLRLHTSLVGPGQPIVRPAISDTLDYEGELAVVLGRGGRDLDRDAALACIAGYTIFNDATVREYQFNTTQWTLGKNFDATGAMGPELVTADELPPGGTGLMLRTRVNGEVVQEASTDDLIFSVPELISYLSRAITLEPGDVVVTGTPSGVGWARQPKRVLRPGDLCEVEIDRFGILTNPIVAA